MTIQRLTLDLIAHWRCNWRMRCGQGFTKVFAGRGASSRPRASSSMTMG